MTDAPKLPTHHKTGEPVLSEVYADPGRHGFYYREKMPDSVMRYVRADTVDALTKAADELETYFNYALNGPWLAYHPDAAREALATYRTARDEMGDG